MYLCGVVRGAQAHSQEVIILSVLKVLQATHCTPWGPSHQGVYTTGVMGWGMIKVCCTGSLTKEHYNSVQQIDHLSSSPPNDMFIIICHFGTVAGDSVCRCMQPKLYSDASSALRKYQAMMAKKHLS